MKKTLKFMLAGLILMSACSSNDNYLEQNAEMATNTVKPRSALPLCTNCSNPKELKTYFDSINYIKMSKSDKLIIRDINEGLFQADDRDLKKEVFFKSTYPLAYQVNKEIKLEKRDLAKNRNIAQLMKKYKVDNVADLKVRLGTIPVSIIMAQAAIESAYGTSRFAEEGNALFGQWTTNPNGMTPREKPDSKWKVARFATPLDSARSYALNINTNSTYREFRKLRSEGKDPIDGLGKYSQKGDEYMKILSSIIDNNNLINYK